MKKSLSVLMALVMALTCLSFSTTAFAADPAQCATISFDGTYNDSYLPAVLDSINQKRAQNGYQPVALDATLTAVAKQRAAEICVFTDFTNDSLPNGDPISTYLSGVGITCATLFSTCSLNIDSIISCLYYIYGNSSYVLNSIGIGLFTVGNSSFIYCVASVSPANSIYNSFVDTNTTVSVNTKIENLDLRMQLNPDKKYFRYDVAVKCYFPNGYLYSIDLPISQFTVNSNKSSVMKVKNFIAYPKKNGSFAIIAKHNSNPALTVKFDSTSNLFNNINVAGLSVKSTKKKRIVAKWRYSISDASGYEIQYSTSKKFKKSSTKRCTVKGKKKVSKTISNLKSKKVYYIRVRAYINQGNGEKCYSGYSKTKSIKVK